jgi:hypothetical protein
VRWRADRGDYVGVGTIEFWSRVVAGRLLALVFHWVHGTDDEFLRTERDWIMNTVRIDGGR